MTHTQGFPERPVVLVFAGHDPTGGAGVQADIEALASGGCHAATVITALTVQDTRCVRAFQPVDPALITAQGEAILADMPVAAVKIGMLGSAEATQAIRRLLTDHPELPVVLDPVLKAGGGGELATAELIETLVNELLPLTTLITPNSLEVRQLAGSARTLDACAARLLAKGTRAVLITGTHEDGDDITHTLWRKDTPPQFYTCPRLPGEYHGSGCTLASAIAAGIAQGMPLERAIATAQAYTFRTLQCSFTAGGGQRIPDRFTGHET